MKELVKRVTGMVVFTSHRQVPRLGESKAGRKCGSVFVTLLPQVSPGVDALAAFLRALGGGVSASPSQTQWGLGRVDGWTSV